MTAEHQNEGPSNEGADDRNLSIQGSADDSTIVVGDHNTIQHINVFSPITVGAATKSHSAPLSKQEYRWRQVLVDNVKHYWIEGVLKKSLHNQALIELGLEERSTAVASPLRGVGEFPDEPSQTFPEGTQATAIFDGLGAGRTLLILGDPGAGKTTTLLKLAQSLLERIGDELSQPIPVILNLSSWAKKRQPIAEWLVQDLYETFQVSKALGKAWIDDEQLILCLDGLDEVAEKHRNACVEALNQFIQGHGRTEMVVCSRVKDYDSLSARLRLRSAIFVQPLTPQQVEQYLEQAGESLTSLRTVLTRNAEIKAFAASPLILSVMSLVYQGCSLEQFPQLNDADNFQQQLFEAYVQRMFQRRNSTTCNYSNEQTTHWLIWMAQRMVQASQTVFYIENMQPSWFQTWVQRLRYRLESSLILGLFYGLNLGLFYGLNLGLLAVLIHGSIAGLIALTLGDIEPVETLKWSWEKVKRPFHIGLIAGLMSGLVGGLMTGLMAGLAGGSIAGLIFWLMAGLAGGLAGGLICGLICGLIFVLISGLMGELKAPGMSNKTTANQGIWRSARNAGIFTLIFTLIFGLIAGLLVLWNERLICGRMAGLICVPFNGFTNGLIGGLIGGGSACLRHFSLRLMLFRMGYAPWNYARFLDYATERLFLQRVGGGYIFIHRMLLEHFAQMELEQKRPK